MRRSKTLEFMDNILKESEIPNKKKVLKEWDSSKILDAIFSAADVVGEDPDWYDVIEEIVNVLPKAKWNKFLKNNETTEEEFWDTLEEYDIDSIISNLESYLSPAQVDKIVRRYEDIANEDGEEYEEEYEEFEESEKLDEKINKDNIEINKAIANPNLGRNQDRIKQAGYDIEYDGDYIKNPKTGKGVWPKEYDREEKKKVDFKGKLDSERPTISKTKRFMSDIKDNKIPKSAKLTKNEYNRDETEYYSPVYNDDPKKSISSNINYYKKAVKDRDKAKDSAEYNKKSLGYYEKKVQDAQKDLDREKDYIKDKEKEADFAEQKRKELIDKVRAKKTSTVKEGAESLIKGLKKIIKESGTTTEIITITDGTNTTEFNFNSLDFGFGIGDYFYNGNETGAQIGFAWFEEKGQSYVESLFLTVYVGNNEENDLKTLDNHLKNLTPDEAFKVTLSPEDYQTFLKWKEMCDVKEFTYWNNLDESENKEESKLTEARQEEILSKLPKKKMNEEEAYEEPGQEQQLNEETVGEKIISPSGKFWIGDPCYVLSDDIYYGVWDDKYNFQDGKIDVDDKLSFLVHGTAYGDGSYPGNGFDYGVDSGTLAVIPMDLIAKTDGVQFGTVETSNTAWLDYNDGNFDITLDDKSFTIETGDYEEDDEDWESDNDLDESEETKGNAALEIAKVHFADDQIPEFENLDKETQFKRILAYLTEVEYDFCKEVSPDERNELIDITIKEINSLRTDYPDKKDELDKAVKKLESIKV